MIWQEGDILAIGDTFAPYSFEDWRQCGNFIIDKCYGTKRALTLVEKDEEHLDLRCPLTGEYLTVLAGPDDLEEIHEMLISQNLYRREKRS